MHITAVDVISLNGKITQGVDAHAHTWTSDEDWHHFLRLMQQHNLLVMGRTTYEAVRPELEPERLRIVLTHRPQDYKAETVTGQLEFMSETPENLVKLLEKRGYTRALLVGGKVNMQFWEAGLVDEAFITIEPVLFGRGQQLVEDLSREPKLQLSSVRQLNERGTLLLQYLVDREKSIR